VSVEHSGNSENEPGFVRTVDEEEVGGHGVTG
jgi:hypothetical protein